MKTFYGIFFKSDDEVLNKKTAKKLKDAGISEIERRGFSDEKTAIDYMRAHDKFKPFIDLLIINEYGYL